MATEELTKKTAVDILTFGNKFTLIDHHIDRLEPEELEPTKDGRRQWQIKSGYWIIRVDKTGEKE